tara:strand:- start:1276 stop:1755 length:480 start_codon:yes stop_codon:yes gene_type:complete
MNTILIFFAGYIALHFGLNIVVHSYRVRLMSLISEAKKLNLSKVESRSLETLAKTAYSIRSAPALMLMFIGGLLQSEERIREELEELEDDADEDCAELWESGIIHKILDYHMASVAAANPIFGALAYLFRIAFSLRIRFHFDKKQKAKVVDLLGLKAAV